jgi:hypothetical protein
MARTTMVITFKDFTHVVVKTVNLNMKNQYVLSAAVTIAHTGPKQMENKKRGA